MIMRYPTYKTPLARTPEHSAEHLVIFLHGYGANGEDLLGLASHFEKALPKAVFVAPNAFTEIPDSPMGYQWFDLANMDPALMEKNCASVQERGAALVHEIQQEHAIGPEQTTLVGFSQGTMMALYCALATENLCARVIGYSGGVYMQPDAIKADPKNLDVLLIHGEEDTVVPPSASLDAHAFLKNHGFNSAVHLRPNLEHSIDLEGLQLAQEFMKQK